MPSTRINVVHDGYQLEVEVVLLLHNDPQGATAEGGEGKGSQRLFRTHPHLLIRDTYEYPFDNL